MEWQWRSKEVTARSPTYLKGFGHGHQNGRRAAPAVALSTALVPSPVLIVASKEAASQHQQLQKEAMGSARRRGGVSSLGRYRARRGDGTLDGVGHRLAGALHRRHFDQVQSSHLAMQHRINTGHGLNAFAV